MQRYKATIEYCGTRYLGMQKQNTPKTIQSAIENALNLFTNGKNHDIDYCGRTDAGVHAFGQVIHFDLLHSTPPAQICNGINFYLRKNLDEITIKHCTAVESTFHSRFSCTGREYKYYIYNHQFASPIFNGKMHHVSSALNIESMQAVANCLIGTHNFSSLRGSRCQASSPVKTVDFINISAIQPNVVEVHIGAKSFLYKMVRNITGLLIYAGLEKIDINQAQAIMAKENITALPYAAPPHGLYFYKAKYERNATLSNA